MGTEPFSAHPWFSWPLLPSWLDSRTSCELSRDDTQGQKAEKLSFALEVSRKLAL